MTDDYTGLVDRMGGTASALADLADHTEDPNKRELFRELCGIWVDVATLLARFGRERQELAEQSSAWTGQTRGTSPHTSPPRSRRRKPARLGPPY